MQRSFPCLVTGVALLLAACQNVPAPTAALPIPPISATARPAATGVASVTPPPMKDDMPKDPPRTPSLQAEPADTEEAMPAILAVRAKLIESLNAKADDIELIRVEKVRWPEGVLPMFAGTTPRPDTFVRGYRMQFLAANVGYEGRSDLFGGRIMIVKLP